MAMMNVKRRIFQSSVLTDSSSKIGEWHRLLWSSTWRRYHIIYWTRLVWFLQGNPSSAASLWTMLLLPMAVCAPKWKSKTTALHLEIKLALTDLSIQRPNVHATSELPVMKCPIKHPISFNPPLTWSEGMICPISTNKCCSKVFPRFVCNCMDGVFDCKDDKSCDARRSRTQQETAQCFKSVLSMLQPVMVLFLQWRQLRPRSKMLPSPQLEKRIRVLTLAHLLHRRQVQSAP